jgi:nicotinamide-nucleotide amidase
MDAEIIAVGSELLTPERVDTNSLWLTQQLNELGVEVTQKSIVGDDRDRLAAAIAGALQRVPLLILSGGLGPTEDDITREAVAKAIHRRLLFDEEICRWIEDFFTRRGRTMAAVNRRQAFLIEGAEQLPNPNGTAPGQWLDLPGGMVILLPGPPRELKPMFTDVCVPRLRERLPKLHIRTRFYRVAGIGESDLDAMIAPIYKPYANPVTTILAAEGDIQIHLRARAESDTAADALAGELGSQILAKLGSRVYSTNGDPIEAVIGQMLAGRGATLAVAESCTAGMLGGRITEVPGSSQWFAGGFQVYTPQMKVQLLGLDSQLIASHGVVSEAVATAMSEAARQRTGAAYALSVTGEAGPDSASPGVAPGTVWIALAGPGGTEAKVFYFPTGRQRVRRFAVQSALNMLRLHLA